MIAQQIRTWEVLDARVLALYAEAALQREDFIADAEKKPFAYADMALPIAAGQVMLEPKLEARMLQALAPTAEETILHIGGGSGYFAALLGHLAQRVVSVELHAALAEAAQARLRPFANVSVVCADGAHGLPQSAPYDAIVFTASVPRLSPQLPAQLRENGRVLAVIGKPPAMKLQLLRRDGDTLRVQRDILETNIPPLENAPAAEEFSF